MKIDMEGYNKLTTPINAANIDLNSSFVNIYNTQHIYEQQIQAIYKRDPEESQMTYLNLYPKYCCCEITFL